MMHMLLSTCRGDIILSFNDEILKTSGNIINAHNVQVVPNSVGIEISVGSESQILDEFQAIELLSSLNDYLHEYRLGL